MRTRVKRMPLPRFSVTSTPFGLVGVHLDVVVVADDDVDAGERVGDVDQRSGRLGDRAGVRALVAEATITFTPFAAEPVGLGLHRVDRRSPPGTARAGPGRAGSGCPRS